MAFIDSKRRSLRWLVQIVAGASFLVALTSLGCSSEPKNQDSGGTTASTAGSGGFGGGGGAGGDVGNEDVEPAGTSLFIEVYDKTTGAPVPGALVAVHSTFFRADEYGHVLFENLTPGRIVARVYADGYARSSVVVTLTEGVHAGQVANLLPLGDALELVAEQGGTITKGKVSVTIPPASLVDENGQLVTGSVGVTVVPIDPTTDDIFGMPGPLEGVPQGGSETIPLLSYFMADVSLWQDGKPLQLEEGAKATLEFVLPDSLQSSYTLGDTIAAWWFDPDSGIWLQEGVGIIWESAAQVGKLSWIVEAAHFTYWNCDDTWDEVVQTNSVNCYDVTVIDGNNNPVPGKTVSTIYAEPTNTTKYNFSMQTNAMGKACINSIGKNEDGNPAKSNIYIGQQGSPVGPVVPLTGQAPFGQCPGPCIPITLTTNPQCIPGATQACPYNGPAGTQNVGLCKAAKKTCGANGLWGMCTGEVVPTMENCMTVADENCDGMGNSGCPGFCQANSTKPCYSGPMGTAGVGICKAGVSTCDALGTAWGPCVGEVMPLPEICMGGLDEDCDNKTDLADNPPCKCKPGDEEDCYTGPPGTKNVGICKSGKHKCNFDGTNWGMCSDIKPTEDICTLPAADEDCDSVSNEGCPSDVTKSKIFGDPMNNQFVRGVAVDGAGSIFLTGHFFGQVGFGGGALTAAGVPGEASDAFVAKFDSTGAYKWAIKIGDSAMQPVDDQTATSIAVDSNGDVIVVGTYVTSIAFGGTTYTTSASSVDGFVVKLKGSDGSILWSTNFNVSGVSDSLQPQDVAVDVAGMNSVVVVGSFKGAFPCNPTCTSIESDVFVRKYTAAGVTSWTKTAISDGDQVANGVAVSGTSQIFLTGSFKNKLVFGGGCPTLFSSGAEDAFVVSLDTAGNCMWRLGMGDASDQTGVAIAVSNQNNVFVTGHFMGTLPKLDVGTDCPALTSKGGFDVFALMLSPSGTCKWRSRYGLGANGNQFASDIAVDSNENVILAGYFYGKISFDLDATKFILTSAGGQANMYVAKLQLVPNAGKLVGKHQWSKSFGDPDDQLARSIAVDTSSAPPNTVVVAGDVKGTINFDDGVLTSAGVWDIAFARLLP